MKRLTSCILLCSTFHVEVGEQLKTLHSTLQADEDELSLYQLDGTSNNYLRDVTPISSQNESSICKQADIKHSFSKIISSCRKSSDDKSRNTVRCFWRADVSADSNTSQCMFAARFHHLPHRRYFFFVLFHLLNRQNTKSQSKVSTAAFLLFRSHI